MEIIAEVKIQSPFGYMSDDTWEDRFAVAADHGDMISIHTDERWGGSFEDVTKAKSLTDIPVMAKGIHADDAEIESAVAAGADYVLVVGRIPGVHKEKCIIEPHTLEELENLPEEFQHVVWNVRDLSTGEEKFETFEQAREVYDGWLCQASFISSVDDIQPGADAVLVGENLPDFVASL